jgi:hypothetical protein
VHGLVGLCRELAAAQASSIEPRIRAAWPWARVTGAFATSQQRRMFARVITAQAGPQGFDSFLGLAREQLPGASQQSGFKGFCVLTSAETGKVMIISLGETREQMPGGVQDQGRPATWLSHRTSKPTRSRCTSDARRSRYALVHQRNTGYHW